MDEAQNMQAEGLTVDAIKKTLGVRLPERRAVLLENEPWRRGPTIRRQTDP